MGYTCRSGQLGGGGGVAIQAIQKLQLCIRDNFLYLFLNNFEFLIRVVVNVHVLIFSEIELASNFSKSV